MAEITNNLNSGAVRIKMGSTVSAKRELMLVEDQVEITINPGITTAEELGRSLLGQLSIKYVNLEELEKIAGNNQKYDGDELSQLDDYLEKSLALARLNRAGIEVDAMVIKYLPPRKS